MASPPAPALLPKWLGPFAPRPRLLLAIAVGMAAAAVLGMVPNGLRPSTRAILAWDSAALCFLISISLHMAHCSSAQLKAEAARQDAGKHAILALVLLAACASLGAIAVELSLAKSMHGLEKGLRVGLAVGTFAVSWLLVQVIFALHYAHEFYAPEEPELDKDGNGVVGGLAFPGGADPDYWDFIHFAMVIGVASQTADVAFTSKLLRRIGTVHSLVSFAFNTVVLALTINLLAGLF